MFKKPGVIPGTVDIDLNSLICSLSSSYWGGGGVGREEGADRKQYGILEIAWALDFGNKYTLL